LRHKDDHPWIAPSEPALEVVPASKGEVESVEEEFWGGPYGWVIAIAVMTFPPILFLLIPIYIFKRLTSKEDSEPDDENLDANSHQDEDVVGENSGESQLPWWVIEEEAQG
tara:strand:- start:1 stop:333 length:333 start_codon:yes stop_codon:yes gene_type:complete